MLDWLFEDITELDIQDVGEALSAGIFDEDIDTCPECGAPMKDGVCIECGFYYQP